MGSSFEIKYNKHEQQDESFCDASVREFSEHGKTMDITREGSRHCHGVLKQLFLCFLLTSIGATIGFYAGVLASTISAENIGRFC